MQHVRATKIGINNQSWGVSTWGSWVENLGIFPWLSQVLAGQTETAPTTVAGVIVCFPSWDAWDEDRTVIFFGSVDTNCCWSPSPRRFATAAFVPRQPTARSRRPWPEISQRDIEANRQVGQGCVTVLARFWHSNYTSIFAILHWWKKHRMTNFFCVHSFAFFLNKIDGKRSSPPHTHTQRTATTIKLMLTFEISQTSNAGVKN